jgi:hypothetical protein
MRINIFGDLMLWNHTHRSLLIVHFSTDLSLLSRGGGYGSVGHLINAIFSSGLPFKTAAGRLIAMLTEECRIRRSATCVIKRKRRFNTSSLDVSSQGMYGLLFCRL